MKRIIIIFTSFILVIGVGALIMTLTLSNNMKSIRAITVPKTDFSSLSDGTYTGSYYYKDQIGANVTVKVFEGQITEIIFNEHIAGKGTIAEKITDDIIEKQSLEVDSIAGATTSSHVIKLAISNALEE